MLKPSCILIFALLLPSAAQQNPDSDRIHAQIQRIEDALPKITDRGAALFLEVRLYVRHKSPLISLISADLL